MVENIDPAAYIPPPVATSGGQSGSSGRQGQAEDRRPRAPVVDVASVLSMPDHVMPAAIQDAFLQLVEEVERLRDEVERVRMHESYLIAAADRHPFLPVLNRRAFLAGLARLLTASERAELPGSLAYFHVDGIETLRRRHGLLAGDAALAFIVAAMQTELRQTDLVCYLDASDFAVALAVASDEGATAKIDRIVAALKNAPLFWQEHLVPIKVTVGLVHFAPGMTADQALSEACQAMMSGSSALSS